MIGEKKRTSKLGRYKIKLKLRNVGVMYVGILRHKTALRLIVPAVCCLRKTKY
jgi:hypothetical protein